MRYIRAQMTTSSFIFTYTELRSFFELCSWPSLAAGHLLCGLKGRELFVDMLYMHMKTDYMLIFNRD